MRAWFRQVGAPAASCAQKGPLLTPPGRVLLCMRRTRVAHRARGRHLCVSDPHGIALATPFHVGRERIVGRGASSSLNPIVSFASSHSYVRYGMNTYG